ncbi:MAG: hypothetical protein QOE02_1336, partial [Rhodospirillaceae bacterium]|nr:hypothetical protein [Rhodospirillaceae bacterium]
MPKRASRPKNLASRRCTNSGSLAAADEMERMR